MATIQKRRSRAGYHAFRIGTFEVFHVDKKTEELTPGWYWWPCLPGCLPDGEANGPFTSSTAAYRDANPHGDD